MTESNHSPNKEHEVGLKRNISLFEATIFGISFVIGTGIFLKPSTILANAGSTGAALLVWLAAGLISLCAALTIAELAAYIPKLGGMYTYITELYGETTGFLQGWTTILVSGPTGAAASAIAFSTFASYFIEMNATTMRLLSIGVVVLFGILQMISTKGVMKLQVLGTIGKLVPIFAIVIIGMFQTRIPGAINMSLVGSPEKVAISGALLGALWSYDGWIATCTLGDELVEPERNLPKAIVGAIIFVICVYLIFNFVIFKNLAPEFVIASDSIGVDTAETLFGKSGATLVTTGVLISSLFTMNAQMMTNERYILPMAQKELLPGHQKLSKIHPKYQTPINVIILQIILTCAYLFMGNFEVLTNITIFVVWIFFTMAVFGVFILRKKFPRQEGLYQTPLYPIIPIIGITGGIYLLASTLINMFALSMVGIVVGIIGLPVYHHYSKKKSH